MGVFQNNLMGAAAAAASGGGGGFYTHQIANSCRFNHAGYLNDARASDGSATTGTISFWFKRSAIGSAQFLMDAREDGNNYMRIQILADDTIEWQNETGAAMKFELETTQVFRDTSAWYHFVGVIDMTNGTQGNRAQMYINGERVTVFDVETYPADASQVTALNTAANLRLGNAVAATVPLDGYMAEMVVIDGTAQAVTDMGETKNGVWIPKDPSGLTFSTNGFYLKVESSGDLGNDSSGNNNDFVATSLSPHDQMLDSPTFSATDGNGGNFATIGPLWKTSDMTFSEGNLKWTCATNQRGLMSNWAVPIGTKAYWEYIPVTFGGNTSNGDESWVGINQGTAALVGGDRGGKETAYAYGTSNGYKVILNTASEYGATIRANDVVGVAVDRVNHTINFSKNNSWQGTFAISATMDLFPFIGSGGGTSSATGTFNFGADGTFAGTKTAGGNADGNGYGNFLYTPPSGFLAMCSGNLPVADEVDPAQTDDDYPQKLFNTKLYTGTGSSNALTGVGFQPDWTWIKERGGANPHKLTDSTRGVTKAIEIDNTSAEATDSNGLTAFGTDGFTVGSDAEYNNSSDTYASWNWRLNGGTEVSNGNGGIASTVQVDPSGGFSLVKYSGTGSASTVGHGLSSAPTWIFAKRYDTTSSWIIYTTAMTGSYYMTIDAGGMGADSSMWNNTNSTSSVFSVGTAAETNGGTMLAYCWADVKGYIKSGSYEGNGNADGTFVYTGFRPSFIICKSIDSGTSWQMFDDKRAGYNVDNNSFLVDLAIAEATTDMIDILSNGFKLRIATDPNIAETYIYLAMAHNPFNYATAR